MRDTYTENEQEKRNRRKDPQDGGGAFRNAVFRGRGAAWRHALPPVAGVRPRASLCLELMAAAPQETGEMDNKRDGAKPKRDKKQCVALARRGAGDTTARV